MLMTDVLQEFETNVLL